MRIRSGVLWGMSLLAGLATTSSCGGEEPGREETGLEMLAFHDLNPKVIVPGSHLVIDGASFVADKVGFSWLHLDGVYAGAPINTYIPADFVDFDELDIEATRGVLLLLGPSSGVFSGRVSVEVDYNPTGQRFASIPLTMQLQVADHLEPTLDAVVANSVIFVNEPIEVQGEGMLLGGDEGITYARVDGCFRSATDLQTCNPIIPVQVPVGPAEPYDRNHGIFAFSPQIAGIRAGTFEGSVTLHNEHADGTVSDSGTVAVAYELRESMITWVGNESGEAVASLGRYVSVGGGGFVSQEDGGGTSLVLEGQYWREGEDVPVAVPGLELVPDFVDGRLVRYVVAEGEDQLSDVIDVRSGVRGLFEGTVHPIVGYAGDEVVGPTTPASIRFEPVKQVVYLKFNPTYVESLREFGLRAVRDRIETRIIDVLERDYEGVNVEFRTEPPAEYALYATLEIAGPDPNGLGLLGYDNSPGKDSGNIRLNDYIGGVNAETLDSGAPGFGGVFIESLFTFSQHPPPGTAEASGLASATFDQIFDPVRPDTGQPVTTDDLALGFPDFTAGTVCPAPGERRMQVACAVFVLGSVVGSTASHELGHSLGLASPDGIPFHNGGEGVPDQPNRLMDGGAERPFEERAELYGQGPSRFCDEAYVYLREILPTNEPFPEVERPFCDWR